MTAPTPDLTKKYLVRVNTGTTASPVWTKVRGMRSFQDQINTTTEDTTTFDDGIWAGAQFATQIGWGAQFNVLRNRYGGAEDEGQKFLRLAAVPQDEVSQPSIIEVQILDRFGGEECYQGSATVQWAPQSGALAEVQVTLSGAGFRETLASNPLNTPEAPAIASITPTGAATGELVTITGANFTGSTAVDFGGVAATDFEVVNDAKIVAVLPTDTAGSVDVVVTNSAGDSDAYAYTRAA